MNKRFALIFLLLPIMSSNDIILVNEFIRKRVEDISAGHSIYIRGERLLCEKRLPEFYSTRLFEPAWNVDKNRRQLVRLLSQAKEEGLRPEDYHYGAIQLLLENKRTAEEEAELDMLLTDAYMLYASHILNGKVNPETLDSEWRASRDEGNPVLLLDTALTEKDIFQSVIDLEPPHPSYYGLKTALKYYEGIADNGGWAPIPSGQTLKPGMTDSLRVPLIIQRLLVTNDLQYPPDDPYLYTELISSSIRQYQQRNGLEEDGNLGKMTTESLNVPVEKRIDQIKVNMERFRWISYNLGETYIYVNIADFKLRVYENNSVVLEEKVIVGKPFRKTPVFTSRMEYIVLNPYWTVPPTILYEDMIPEVKKNMDYLASKKIHIYQGNGSSRIEISPDAVNWQEISRNNFPYTLRQDPGPLNALGIVKFMFPNKYNVYIHDTPTKELFNRTERTFSSGCIRLNNPRSLLQYLTAGYLDTDMEKIDRYLDKGQEITIVFTKPLNVHILYLTAWVENDIIQFRKDIYDRDSEVLQELNAYYTGV